MKDFFGYSENEDSRAKAKGLLKSRSHNWSLGSCATQPKDSKPPKHYQQFLATEEPAPRWASCRARKLASGLSQPCFGPRHRYRPTMTAQDDKAYQIQRCCLQCTFAGPRFSDHGAEHLSQVRAIKNRFPA